MSEHKHTHENGTNKDESFTESAGREYYWVPEDCIFELPEDCFDKHPNPPACLVASHVKYDELKKKLALARETLRLIDLDYETYSSMALETLEKIGE